MYRSQYALWKMREFNELEHIFHLRLNLSVGYCDQYLSQFPQCACRTVAAASLQPARRGRAMR